MDEDFDIFDNLNTLLKTKALRNIPKQDQTKDLNSNQTLDSDLLEIEQLKEDDKQRTPPKRKARGSETMKVTAKASKEPRSPSLSPVSKLLESAAARSKQQQNRGRRTRSSIGKTKEVAEVVDAVQIVETTIQQMSATGGSGAAGRGRGRGKSKTTTRGRGRGRGRGGRGGGVTPETVSNSFACNESEIENVIAAVQAEIASPGHEARVQALMNSLQATVSSNATSSRRYAMRARRQYLAEIAARSSNVDFVDLVTAPIPRINGVVTVDSDDDKEVEDAKAQDESLTSNTSLTNETDFDTSFDPENPEISVKVKWVDNIEVIHIRKYQKFHHIFETLAERKNVSMEKIVLNLDNKIIKPEDTAASLNYKIYQFLCGRVLEDFSGANFVKTTTKNKNIIKLKVQSDTMKRPIQLEIERTDKFRILLIKCAEELNVPVDKIKLSFDGEPLESTDTPNDLELTGGEIIDLRIKAK